jgi:2-beta-glucuronyltransferase
MAVGKNFLMLSRHDYRTRRKANVHFIARELAQLGTTRFFSSSFSWLSHLTHDQRLPLWHDANSVGRLDGVETYLWRTLTHPCAVPPLLQGVMDLYFKRYIRDAPATLRQWISEADVVFVESGGPEIFFDLVRTANPNCKIIYICSDTLETIGASAFVRSVFRRIASDFDGVRVPSRLMASAFPPASKLHYVPHGFDADELQTESGSPYRDGPNVVSVGNMLFDPFVFEVAAKAFPNVRFHVIGGGRTAARLAAPNITIYGEMPFKDTLRYLKHADAGVAPYLAGQAAPYLTDTSMKLVQYSHFGLPAICPTLVAGRHTHRFGYDRDTPGSIAGALRNALGHGRFPGSTFLSWPEVVQRLLSPDDFPDTFMT